jgi:hypothetical protein
MTVGGTPLSTVATQAAGAGLVHAPIDATDPTRTPGTIDNGSIDPRGRLRVNTNPPLTTPSGPLVSSIATGGVAVTIFNGGSITNVIDIINPFDPDGSNGNGECIPTEETLYIDFVGTATPGSATTIPLVPGQPYRISGPISTPVTAVAATSGHCFVAVSY